MFTFKQNQQILVILCVLMKYLKFLHEESFELQSRMIPKYACKFQHKLFFFNCIWTLAPIKSSFYTLAG